MSVQFVGARSLDDRRRRRLAVSTEGGGTALAPEDLSRLERRGLAADSIVAVSAPWIPQTQWRIWTGGILLTIGLVLVGLVAVNPLALRPEFQALQTHLLEPSHPVLVNYLQSVVWAGITAWALLIGWYRSRSQSDFGGRYRIWSWFALLLGGVGFFAGTDAHRELARIAVATGMLPARAGTLIWQIPLLSAGLPLGVLIDRDLRRSRVSLVLYRITSVVLLSAAAAPLLAPSLAGALWFAYASVLLPLAGMGLLFLTLWLQSWYVAYFCPDPPDVEPGRPSLLSRVLGPVARLLDGLTRLFRRKATEDEEESKPRRRRKKAEGEAAPTAPRRKRKATTRRAAKPRTRTRKVEVEEEEVESEELEESAEWHEESAAEDAWDEVSSESNETADWSEAEEADDEPPAPSRKSSGSSRSTESSRQPVPEPVEDSSTDDEWSDDDGQNYRVDGPSAEQLKGLSKKQRRDLRKQWKEQQRGR